MQANRDQEWAGDPALQQMYSPTVDGLEMNFFITYLLHSSILYMSSLFPSKRAEDVRVNNSNVE